MAPKAATAKKKEPSDKVKKPRATRSRKAKVEPGSVGLEAAETGDGADSAAITALVARIE